MSPDADLLALSAAASDAAFADLFDRHYEAVFRYARRVSGSDADAADATQATFITAWSKIRSVRLVGESALPWLLTTCRFQVLNLLRSRKRRAEVELTDAVATLSGPDDDPRVAWAIDEIAQLGEIDRRACELTLDEHRDEVRTGVLSGITRRRVRRHRIQLAIAAGSVVVLAGAGIGAAAIITAPQFSIDHFVECYADDDPGMDANGVATDEDEPPMDVIEYCSYMWQKDMIGPGPGPADPNDPNLNMPVPRLAACLGRHGVGAAFPIWDENETAEELCTRLGLPVWDPSLQSPQ